jgi:hypothetical protein
VKKYIRQDIDNETLKHEYVELKQPTTVLGLKYNCSAETIANRLKDMGVKLISSGEWRKLISNDERWCKYKIDRDWLEDKYINCKLTPKKIAEEVGCELTVITERLKKYNIPLRSMKESAKLVDRSGMDMKYLRDARLKKNGGDLIKFKISKDELYEKYVMNKRSMADISDDYGCSIGTIKVKLVKYEIPIRSGKDAHNMPIY